MKNEKMSYEDAFAELEAIRKQLENNNIGIDQLAEQVKRAYTLLKYCKEKLRATEQALNELNAEN